MLTRQELLEKNKNRCLGQICYVTRDYKSMMAYMVEKLEIGPWTILSISDKTTTHITYNGEPYDGPFKYYVAITQVGDVQLEIIQPESGPNPYDKFLDEKGPGLHHIKLRVDDNDELAACMKEFEALGNFLNYTGRYSKDHHYYIDTYDALGSYVETGNFAEMEIPEYIGYYPEK